MTPPTVPVRKNQHQEIVDIIDKIPDKTPDKTDTKTRIYRTPTGASPEPPAASSNMDDPPVGWLVVVSGPGQGASLTLGNGGNSIGRDASQRVVLDFGDEMISRTGHATVTYDPLNKKFHIQHGGGTNLTYVNDQPVLAPQELPANTHILLGNTTLRFVPLCGKEFDWEMVEQGGSAGQ